MDTACCSSPAGKENPSGSEYHSGAGLARATDSLPGLFTHPGLKINRPTLLVDEALCRRNIARMAEKARIAGVRFRPHFKTHQSAAIGEWFREAGVTAITVSSVSMARYFSGAGWSDITIAFPVNLREMEEINRLAGEIHLLPPHRSRYHQNPRH